MNPLQILPIVLLISVARCEEATLRRKRNAPLLELTKEKNNDVIPVEETGLTEDEEEFIRFLQQEASFSFSYAPSSEPSKSPPPTLSDQPSTSPSLSKPPSIPPSDSPSSVPSLSPSASPSLSPSVEPSKITEAPSVEPSKITEAPSNQPSRVTESPSASPSHFPSQSPSGTIPTPSPTSKPTPSPTKSITTPLPTPSPSKLVTPVPSPVPTISTCIDSSTFFWKKEFRTCAFIDEEEWRTNTYCVYEEIRDACPRTCGKCCFDDRHFQFIVRDKARRCAWIGRKSYRPGIWCPQDLPNGDKVQDHCPETCGTCRTEFTNPPTASPAARYCKNDDNWHWYNSPEVTCKWIRNKEKRRQKFCPKEVVHISCPQSCGECCENDPVYTFTDPDTGISGNCASIESMETGTEEFCKKYLNKKVVRDACPLACDFCFNTVTAAPTPSIASSPPTPVPCLNNNDWTWYNAPKVTCRWIRNKQFRREKWCQKSSVLENCPQSCGLCCVDDPSYNFFIEGDYRDCEWVGELSTRKSAYCDTYQNLRMVRDACPLTCDRCLDPI